MKRAAGGATAAQFAVSIEAQPRRRRAGGDGPGVMGRAADGAEVHAAFAAQDARTQRGGSDLNWSYNGQRGRRDGPARLLQKPSKPAELPALRVNEPGE
jgi:hypothetical protein